MFPDLAAYLVVFYVVPDGAPLFLVHDRTPIGYKVICSPGLQAVCGHVEDKAVLGIDGQIAGFPDPLQCFRQSPQDLLVVGPPPFPEAVPGDWSASFGDVFQDISTLAVPALEGSAAGFYI